MSRSIESIVLGTAQFGGTYGIANRLGMPDSGQVREIIELAYELGVRVLDTAAAYGSSEAVLGACGVNGWQVITKVPTLESYDDNVVGCVAYESVLRSLELLRVDSLKAVLLHDYRDAVGERGRRILDALGPLMETGHIGRMGVSVYAPDNMRSVDAVNYQVVQAPMNVFDQRVIISGEAVRLNALGGELHVRSLFLQGLLLMRPIDRPKILAPWLKQLNRFDLHVRESGLDPLEYCIGFVASQSLVECLVVGVETADQLYELIAAFSVGTQFNYAAQGLASDDLGLIDPREWRHIS